jgi:sugar phosphate isomerase/epimerase
MIYISSACVKAKTIGESMEKIGTLGYDNIELSGGTNPYPELEADLIEARKNGKNLLLHNYFPPPPAPFVLNLASLDGETADLSLEHAANALRISTDLGCDKFGIHAGFLINIPVNQIGKSIDRKALFNRDEAMEFFLENLRQLMSESNPIIFVENNVIAPFNLENFKGDNPFFLTSSADYFEMAKRIDLNLLLDVAHLKVSCSALGLDFNRELDALMPLSSYIHISDNDGQADSNNGLKRGSDLYKALSRFDLSNKTITIEVYDGPESVLETYNAIHSLL